MRKPAPILIACLLLAGAAPLPPGGGRHGAQRALDRIHAAADKAIDAPPLTVGAERLPAPVGWVVMLGGFGLLGTLLRQRRADGRMDPATFR